MSKIKIYSDVTVGGTRVFQEDGTEIKGVTQIEWKISGYSKDQTARTTLTFEDVEVEVAGKLHEDR